LDKKEEKADFLLTATIKEPYNYKQAINSPYKTEWYNACLEEIREFESQKIYNIVDKPIGQNILSGRWVFKEKPITDKNTIKSSHITNKDNTIRFKARWCIQGYNQRLGIDFLDTFSTTCRPETWHFILIIAVNKGYPIVQFDVKNAFLHANIDKDIYTILPEGFYKDPKYNNKVAKLNKALYGLKQSPRLWYKYLYNALKKLGYTIFPYDEGVFINKATNTIILCHVDDILIISSNLATITDISDKLAIYIKLEKIGPVATFLGNDISINYDKKSLYIHQTRYTNKLLSKFNITNNNNYKPSLTPGTPGIKLRKNTEQASNKDINNYQKQIGSLLFLALKTRLDIAYNVCYCARFMSNPSKDHYNELNKIWGYLLKYPNKGLYYNCKNDLIIKGYSDSDWGNNLDNRKSTSGYIFSIGDITINNPISWNSQLQKTVALSSCEAEYMALKEATKEAIYLYNMFSYLNNNLNLGYNNNTPIIFIDNEAAKKLAENPEFHKKSKHIQIIYHFTREAIANNQIRLLSIPSKEQLADILTKSVINPLYKSLITAANIIEKPL
jgi:hypothetical protein